MTQTEIRQRDALARLLENGDLRGFEAEFAASMAEKADDFRLTEKQSDKLEQLYRRHCEE